MTQNPFTELTGISYPIVCGGMLGVGRASLVAAVSEAGALGILSGLTQPTAADLRDEIRRTRDLTARPIGVNLTVLPTLAPVPYDEFVDTLIDEGVRIVETAGRSPEPFMRRLKEAGVTVIHKATSVRHALSAERLGVDAVSIDGYECAGHPGGDDVGGLVLIAAASAQLSIPVIASGGIADGRGLAAALALGACAVNMGTRFVATQESAVHENVKRQIVANDERSTNVVFRKFRNAARVAKNSVSNEIVEIESREGTTFADVAALASGARGRERVLAGGDIEGGMWWAGQSQGLIDDIPTVHDLVQRIIAEAVDAGRRIPALLPAVRAGA